MYELRVFLYIESEIMNIDCISNTCISNEKYANTINDYNVNMRYLRECAYLNILIYSRCIKITAPEHSRNTTNVCSLLPNETV